jgi:FAD synthase
VTFERWLRAQRAFDDLDALVAQMGDDVDEARRFLT